MSFNRYWPLAIGLSLFLISCGGSSSEAPPSTAVLASPSSTPEPSATPTASLEPSPLPSEAGLPGTIVFSAGLHGSTDKYTVNLLGPDDEPARPLLAEADLVPMSFDAFPIWSPDGTRVAFIRLTDPQSEPELHIVDVDDSDLRQLVADPAPFRDLAWSPDGSWLAFISIAGSIEIISTVGAEQRQLVAGSDTMSPSWSPDGTRIAFEQWTGTGDADIISIEDADVQALTEDQGQNTKPAWSPDGLAIAFQSTRDGEPGVYVMSADGSNQRRLGDDVGPSFFPSWSPDGALIAFAAYTEESGEIYITDVAGDAPRAITDTPERDDVYPTWSPDGQFLVYLSHPRGPDPELTALSELRMVSIDGSDEVVIATELYVEPFIYTAPVWRPAGHR